MDASIKTSLRQRLRQQRRAIPAAAQQRAGLKLLQQLKKLPAFHRAQRIAFYLASDGEISTRAVLRYCQQRGKRCYLPVVHPSHKQPSMRFHRHRPGQTLRNNRFEIAEPNGLRQRPIAPENLDIVLLPLVAFDRRGNRLGMGGGFYDRALAFTQRRSARRNSPLLIGLAHRQQELERLPNQHWDIPLHWIATDQALIAAGPN